jgi:hypothetical protein
MRFAQSDLRGTSISEYPSIQPALNIDLISPSRTERKKKKANRKGETRARRGNKPQLPLTS